MSERPPINEHGHEPSRLICVGGRVERDWKREEANQERGTTWAR